MHIFTIRDIENLTGIKAHTIRIWEQRYNLTNPERKSGNHRLYSNEDLKKLLRVTTLYRHGHKISKLASLTSKEISQLLMQTAQTENTNELYITQLIEISIDLDEERFENAVNSIIDLYGFEKAVFEVFFPLLIKVGLFWMTGHVIPAQEHFASNVILRKIAAAIDGLPTPESNPKKRVGIFTPEKEFHELPILMMQYLMKKNGIPSTYFGSHVSLKAIRKFVDQRPITHLYCHMITFLMRKDPEEFLYELSILFPKQKIIVSGNFLESVQRKFVNVELVLEERYMSKVLEIVIKS